MALKVDNTIVIDNNRNILNVTSFDSTVASIWDTVTVTATGKTLVNREHCTVTASGQTITLPLSPSAGWEVVINVGNFVDTVIGRNGSNIMGLAENMTIDLAYAPVNLIYTNASQGWRVY